MFRVAVVCLALLLSACGDAVRKEGKGANVVEKPSRWVIVKNMKSKYTKLPHTLILYLPKDYGEDTNSRYPVLYAHDGQNLIDPKTAFGGNTWKLDKNIEELQAKGLLGKVIVVGVYNNSMRMDEYTPSRISNQYVRNGGGQLSNYSSFLVEELKPWMDSNYRTLPGRKDTFVMGSSLGGLASMYLLAWNTNVFGGAACVSPSFWWATNRVQRDLEGWEFPDDTRIYIDGGWKEEADESQMVIFMRGAVRTLVKKGFRLGENLSYYEDPEGMHNESTWAARGKYPLLFLMGNFSPGIEKIRIGMVPRYIGVGDESFLFTEVFLSNGTRSTRFDAPYSFSPSGNLRPIDGGVRGIAPGNTVISTEVNGVRGSLEVAVLPKSREYLEVNLNYSLPEGAKTAALEVKRMNGSPTNLSIPMAVVGGVAVCTVTASPGSQWTVGVLLDGKPVLNLEDKPWSKNLVFKREATNIALKPPVK